MTKLSELIKVRIAEAAEAGSVQPFQTYRESIISDGICFDVRVAASLSAKPQLSPNPVKSPFLPPFAKGMFVADIGHAHRLILNKFNVLPVHVVLATNDGERHQNGPLIQADFQAVAQVLQQLGSSAVAFYNHGKHSGYSQDHLHIQVVELDRFPMRELYVNGRQDFIALTGIWEKDDYVNVVEDLMKSAGLDWSAECSFNLLWDHEMIVVIPRSAQTFKDEVSLNGLSYSGSLFVKTQQGLDLLKAEGPLEVLSSLALKK